MMFQNLKKLMTAALGSTLALVGLGSLMSACDDDSDNKKDKSQYTYEELEACGDPSGADFKSCIEAYRGGDPHVPVYYGMPPCSFYNNDEDVSGKCEQFAIPGGCDEEAYRECIKSYEKDPCGNDGCIAYYGPAFECSYYDYNADKDAKCAEYEYNCDEKAYNQCIEREYTELPCEETGDCPVAEYGPPCSYYDESADYNGTCEDYAWGCDEAAYKECMKVYDDDPCGAGGCQTTYGPAWCDYYDPGADYESVCAEYSWNCDEDAYNKCMENYKPKESD